jgi:hypothetical protein
MLLHNPQAAGPGRQIFKLRAERRRLSPGHPHEAVTTRACACAGAAKAEGPEGGGYTEALFAAVPRNPIFTFC